MLRAGISTGAAEDAFRVFDPPAFYHLGYIKAHRALAGASLATIAQFPRWFHVECRQLQKIAYFSSDDLEDCHVADTVTGTPPSQNSGDEKDRGNDDIINCEREQARGRDPMVRMI